MFVGSGALGRLVADLLDRPPGGPTVVVADDAVAPLHAHRLTSPLGAAGLDVHLLTFPAGEPHKTRETKARLEDALVELDAGRDCLIVGLGGGVTTDLAGFLAATWTRGVALIQAPTSLLAMVDAAIGGKTGLNHPRAKNLIGAFWQPRAVYADVDVLETLPEEALRDGFAELIKAAAIADLALFERLERDAGILLSREREALAEAIAAGVAIKAAIVGEDPLELGRRALLNYGHTAAHAIEIASGHRIGHGRAVAIGMTVESAAAADAGRFPQADVGRLASLLERFELPTSLERALERDALDSALGLDKKRAGRRLRLAVPDALGTPPAGPALFEVERRALLDRLAGTD